MRWRFRIAGPARRRLLITLALFVIAAGAVYGFRKLGKDFRWDLFLATFHSLRPAWLATAVLIILLTYVVRALRWRIMLLPLRPHPGVWSLISATCIGFTAVTLFGRPGELVRPWLISVRERVPLSSQLAAWLLERIYDLLMVLLIFGVSLTRTPGDLSSFGPAIQWVFRTGGYLAAGLGVACVGILVMVSQFSDTSRRRLTDALGFLPDKFHRRLDGLIAAFTSGMSSARSRRQVAALLGWSVVEWFLIAVATQALFWSIPATAHFRWFETLLFLGFVAFGGVVQIPGIGGGLQVAAVIVLTELLGVPLASATGVAILFWAVTFLLIVPIGLILMFVEGVKLSSLRHIGETAGVAATAPEGEARP